MKITKICFIVLILLKNIRLVDVMIKKECVSDTVLRVYSNKYKLVDKEGIIRNATKKYPIFIYKDFIDFVFECDEEIDPEFDKMMDEFSKM